MHILTLAPLGHRQPHHLVHPPQLPPDVLAHLRHRLLDGDQGHGLRQAAVLAPVDGHALGAQGQQARGVFAELGQVLGWVECAWGLHY